MVVLQQAAGMPKKTSKQGDRGSKGAKYGGGFVQVRMVGVSQMPKPRNWIRHRWVMTGRPQKERWNNDRNWGRIRHTGPENNDGPSDTEGFKYPQQIRKCVSAVTLML